MISFFGRSVYEHHHVRSPINFAIHKIKLGILTVGMFKNNLKGIIEKFGSSDNTFAPITSFYL